MKAIQSTATSARKAHVPGEFDRVAQRYDRMCAMNPGYSRHLRLSAERLEVAHDARLADLCCGTGLSTTALLATYPEARVTALDASAGMLEVAAAKHELNGVQFVAGDATDPAAAGVAGPFDGILMAYGLRNLPQPDACLVRLLQLLQPGGTLCLHEYSVADSLARRVVWNAITCGIVIPLALPVCGTTEIFRYLRRSVNEFDGVLAIEARLRAAGFDQVQTFAMDGWAKGILHTFRARRPIRP